VRRPFQSMAFVRLAATQDRGEQGFIIVAVLWILAALATFATVYSLYVSSTAIGSRVGQDRLQAEALVSAALELTAFRLLGATDENRPRSGDFGFQMGHANVTATFRSEGARIDLNEAPKELLAGLFSTLGAKPDDAAYDADRIIGWRKKTKVPGENAEVGLYKDASLDYGPRQAPFQNVAELRFVLGLPPALVESALPFVTVFNGTPKIDVIKAAPEVIASLPHINPGIINAVLAQRDAQDPKATVAMLGQAGDNVSTEARKSVRVDVAVHFDKGRNVNAEAVIMLIDKDTEPFRVLEWRDDFDGPL
jgi:general secretion pathway protein K